MKKHLIKNSLINQLLNTTYQKPISREEINMIMGDLVVSQNNISRKSHIEKKEVIITTENEIYKEILSRVFHASIISQILETYLYGINVFEINWEKKQGLFIPTLVGRDFQDFKFNNEGKLVFIGNGFPKEIPPYKVVYGIYNQSFRAPYGESALRRLYFSVSVKNATLDFWIAFLERFGSPWAVAKTEDEPEKLALEVSAMLNGSTAVVSKEEEIALIQPSAKSDFKELVKYCDGQINRFMLGGNLTGEVSSGSLAAAQIHNTIRSEIALSDERILLYVANRVISFFKEINNIKEEIKFTLFNESEPKTELAKRDKVIFDMGYQPTKDYIEKTYNLTTAEKKESIPFKNALNTQLMPIKNTFKDKINKNLAFDAIDNYTNTISFKDLDLKSVLENAKSFEEAHEAITNALKGEDLEIAEAMLARAIMNAQIYGALNA